MSVQTYQENTVARLLLQRYGPHCALASSASTRDRRRNANLQDCALIFRLICTAGTASWKFVRIRLAQELQEARRKVHCALIQLALDAGEGTDGRVF